MTAAGNGLLFQVRASAYVLDRFKELHAIEFAIGNGERFIQALRALYDRLRNDPNGFGEPLYRLPALKMVVHLGILARLVVHYGVHEDKPLVFIKSVDRLN